MSFVLDAWLERPEPRLRVLDGKRVVLDLPPAVVRRLLESGELVAEDFRQPCRHAVQALIRRLFLLGCVREARLGETCGDCERCLRAGPPRRAALLAFPAPTAVH